MSISLPNYSESFSIPGLIGLLSLSYILVCRSLRWRNFNAIHKRYQHKLDASGQALKPGETLTPEEAQEIMLVSFWYDMPMLTNLGTLFGTFKVFAIVSLSLSLSLLHYLELSERW
jgi:hypothetical protein